MSSVTTAHQPLTTTHVNSSQNQTSSTPTPTASTSSSSTTVAPSVGILATVAGTSQTSVTSSSPTTATDDPLSSLGDAATTSQPTTRTLTPGASAGIAIGVILGAAILVALAILLRRRIMARKATAAARRGSVGSGRSVLVGGKPIGPPMQQPDLGHSAFWFGQSRDGDAVAGARDQWNDSEAYMHGPREVRLPPSPTGTDFPYTLNSYYESDSHWLTTGHLAPPVPPVPAHYVGEMADRGGTPHARTGKARPGSARYDPKFDSMYWDNLHSDGSEVDQNFQTRHH